jgi:CubicO group peptidase (beta-lactamase class C family)
VKVSSNALKQARDQSGDIEALVDAEIQRGCFPGIVLLVEQAGKIIFSLVKGSRQLHPKPEVMTADTLFDLGSITKPLATALLTLKACQQEGIHLERKIGEFLPEIVPQSGQITLRQLLLHTGGLPPDPFIYKKFPGDRPIDRNLAVRQLLAIVPEKPPGTEVIYSCTGYLLLGLFLERVTNSRLSELFRTTVTERCGIEDLFFRPRIELRPRTAATEFCSWRKRWIRGEVHDENSYCLGGDGGNAGLFGTAGGVLELLSIFDSQGQVKGIPLLSPTGVGQMSSCLTQGMGERRSIGFLIQGDGSPVGPEFSRSSFGHTGFPGTSIWIEPEKRLKIVTLTNRVHLGREHTDSKIKEFRKTVHSAIYQALRIISV